MERDCRKYYQAIDTKRWYCHYIDQKQWYTVNPSGGYFEPDCPVKQEIVFEIVPSKKRTLIFDV